MARTHHKRMSVLCAAVALSTFGIATATVPNASATETPTPVTGTPNSDTLEIRNRTDRYQEPGKSKTFTIHEVGSDRHLATLTPGQSYPYQGNNKVTIKVDGQKKMEISTFYWVDGKTEAPAVKHIRIQCGDNFTVQYNSMWTGDTREYSYYDKSWWVYCSGIERSYQLELWRINEECDR